jgi:hypothetical protein
MIDRRKSLYAESGKRKESGGAGNPKHEIRTSKQIRMPETGENAETEKWRNGK